jgi:hypothetical protein
MDINIFYKPNIISLFIDDFENISNKYIKEKYNWNFFSKIFNNLFIELSNQNINENDFIKYYYLYTLLYLNYTNYLAFINHNDLKNPDIEKIIKMLFHIDNILINLL